MRSTSPGNGDAESVASASTVDHAEVAEILAALAYAPRLELMEILRIPRSIPDISLKPLRASAASANPDRSVSRQTVAAHLAKLVSADLVREEREPGASRRHVKFVANAPRLYEVLDDLRRICVRTLSPVLAADETRTVSDAPTARHASGPRLVLVRGVNEGQVFPLKETAREDGTWKIGRRRGLQVALDFDRYVSTTHAIIQREAGPHGGHRISDAPESKNGTFVNWARLGEGEQHNLRSGDVISVGRTMLVFTRE